MRKAHSALCALTIFLAHARLYYLTQSISLRSQRDCCCLGGSSPGIGAVKLPDPRFRIRGTNYLVITSKGVNQLINMDMA